MTDYPAPGTLEFADKLRQKSEHEVIRLRDENAELWALLLEARDSVNACHDSVLADKIRRMLAKRSM